MNPYEVLGVPDNSDEETVKKAYRELVKKYHPDKYVNNPLADLATEKLKEVNKAYDMIMNQKSSSGGYSTSYSSGSDPKFSEVRNLINRGLVTQAEAMLQSLPKNAEWNFLMGLCKIRMGWYDSGIDFIRTAVNMDPDNIEYRSTLNSIVNQTTAYRNTGSFGNSYTGCDCCTQLLCADCCCECMGGDLISCC